MGLGWPDAGRRTCERARCARHDRAREWTTHVDDLSLIHSLTCNVYGLSRRALAGPHI